MGFDPFSMGRKMMTSTGMLMGQNEFKKELKLSGDQNKKISDLAKNHQKKIQEMTKKAQSSGPDMGAMTAQMKEMDDLNDETDKAIRAELTPEQSRRLSQLQWQIVGVKAVYEPDLQKELGLSEDQLTKLAEWKKGENSRMMALVQASRSANAMKDARKKIKKDDETNILGILQPDQLQKYKLALGPESKVAKKLSESGF
ncbi:MAG: hypothetical protein H7Y17_14915 [Chlorobia bacterium]|nr:hypothetical protein [Fimbriimonadaceae bacterium]